MSLEPRILVIEDDSLYLSILKESLKGAQLQMASHLRAALDLEIDPQTDLVLLDLCHPGDPTGRETVALIPMLKRQLPRADLVIQSGLEDIDLMRACVEQGASRFILKQHLHEEIALLFERMKESMRHKVNLERSLVGSSLVMCQLRRELMTLRFESGVNVLIEGETGSGKELCAQALHSAGPFWAVNVSAIPEELFEAEFFGAEKGAYTGSVQSRVGHFEAAGSGILFLDEIQSLPLSLQAKLLRVLETRSFRRVGSTQDRALRARVVSAANQRLRELVSRGKFREDLFYRLAPITVSVPPLRVRGGDLFELLDLFMKDFSQSRKIQIAPDARSYLQTAYDWPGNIRELKSFVQRLVLKSALPVVGARELKEILEPTEPMDALAAQQGQPQVPVADPEVFRIHWDRGFDANVEDLERYLLSYGLQRAKNRTALRDELKLARTRFYDKLNQYGLLTQFEKTKIN